eukprot:TRINITY_DN1739_c0_g1_i1.p1 TRINITY_DN1739_c0_g1~~TRINITY_DN1739_c0_g1_i1.p1  ORF type:complete len:117 (-),score=32.87 TRINITY_DN1739_c0_g1_i1:215-565(-)
MLSSVARCAAMRAACSAPARRAMSTVPQECFIPKDEVTTRVMTLLTGMKQLRGHMLEGALTLDSTFASLRLDELDLLDIAGQVESAFCIKVPEAAALKLAAPKDIIELVATHPQAK